MPQPSNTQRSNTREEAKLYYKNPKNIADKWLDQYGNVSRDNDYQRNRSCMGEVFNMLDVVMDICIENFRKTHTITTVDMVGRMPIYTFALEDSDPAKASTGKDSISFSMPTTFARRVRTLRSIGYPISDELLYDTRLLRNETFHGNQTIVLRHLELGYDETMKAMLSMADTLICLNKLDPILRIPSFDLLRIKEGDSLLGGAYQIGAFIAEGGMSRVYKASQSRTGKLLAIKELKPGTYTDEVVRQECDTLSRLHHPAIPQVYDIFSENDTFYIVMDYIDGVPLERYMELSGFIRISGDLTASSGKSNRTDDALENSNDASTVEEGLRGSFLRSLCDVLSYLHSDSIGLVFADLSPSNILVDKEGQPHLIDFGISGKKEQRQAVPAATPGYSAPEVFSERVLDERTDIYSFGQILRFVYTGLSPFEKADTTAFDLVPDPVIAEVIERCTERSPVDRYASIEEVRSILFPNDIVQREAPAVRQRHSNILAVCGICAALCTAALAGYAGVLKNRNAVLEESAASAYDVPLITMEEAGVKDHVIEWKDEGLEAGIRNTLAIETEEIMLSDLWEMTSLSVCDFGVQTIEDLSALRNLQYLTLDYNEISDLSPLSSLQKLQSISVAGNQIEDLSPLASLEQLRFVNASYNLVTDASHLQNLAALSQIWLDGNPLTLTAPDGSNSLDWVSNLPNLQSLHLCGIGLSDCSFLENCYELTDLALSENRISDLSAIRRLDKLKSLYLADNRFSSLDEISGLTGLKQLEIAGNPVVDLSPLTELRSLSWLDAPECGIHDLTPLESLSQMTSLALNDNPIREIAPLSGLTRLSYLDLSNTGIGGVEELSGLTALKTLYLKNNQITDIAALSGLRSLQYLELSGNPIDDYSSLKNLKLLEKDF